MTKRLGGCLMVICVVPVIMLGCGTTERFENISIGQVREAYELVITDETSRSSISVAPEPKWSNKWSNGTYHTKWSAAGTFGTSFYGEDATTKSNPDGSVSLTVYHIYREKNGLGWWMKFWEGDLLGSLLMTGLIWTADPEEERKRLDAVKAILAESETTAK